MVSKINLITLLQSGALIKALRETFGEVTESIYDVIRLEEYKYLTNMIDDNNILEDIIITLLERDYNYIKNQSIEFDAIKNFLLKDLRENLIYELSKSECV